LRSVIEADEFHRVIVWGRGTSGSIQLVETPFKCKPFDSVWRITPNDEIRAIALSYKGIRLGARWWTSFVLESLRNRPTVQLFAALRWLKIPVLAPHFREAVVSAATKDVLAFLRAWWLDEGLPTALGYEPTDDGREGAIRNILWDVRLPQDGIATRILEVAAKRSNAPGENRITDGLVQAAKFCTPMVWYLARSVPKGPKHAKRAMRRLLGLPEDASLVTINDRLKEIERECSRQMGLNVDMIKEMAAALTRSLDRGTPPTSDVDIRLRRAAEIAVGRCLLASSLLRTVGGL
jgi:hypothetical protein